jgi:hypothetical protein
MGRVQQRALRHGPRSTPQGVRHPSTVSEHPLLNLQRTAGNQAVVAMVQRIGPNEPIDAQEAGDSIDDQIRMANQRLDINLNSWDPFVIQRLGSVVNRIFQSEDDFNWWSAWGLKIATDLMVLAAPSGQESTNAKYVGIAVKAIIDAAGRQASQDLAARRSQLIHDATEEMVRLQDQTRREGEDFINEFVQQPYESLHDIHTQGQALDRVINTRYPQANAESMNHVNQVADEVMAGVRTAAQARHAHEEAAQHAHEEIDMHRARAQADQTGFAMEPRGRGALRER